jgi:spore germination cell wall hydrolase CwlJ-like protein
MEPESYQTMDENSLMALCIWREARGELYLVKCCVGNVIVNRSVVPCWWNDGEVSIRSTILKPFQFSSFNVTDPNEGLWPADNDQSWLDSILAQQTVVGDPTHDPTEGATYYHDISISFPKSWGRESEFINTLNLGHMKFYRMKPPRPLGQYVELESE